MAENTETEKNLKNVTKWAGLVFLGMVISKILTYFFRLVIAKYYGPDYYGLISIGISTITLIMTAVLLGLDSGLIRFIAFYNAKKDKEKVKGTLITPFRICVPIAIIASLAIWISAPFIASHFSVDVNQAGYLVSIFRIFSFSIPFSISYSLIISLNKGLQDVKYNIYADYIFSSLLQLILVVLFYSIGFDITGVALAYTLSMIFSFLFIFYFSRRNILSILDSKTVTYTRDMLSYSLPLAAGSFATIAITTIDTILLGVFRTPSETGVYNAAMPTAGIIYLFASAFAVLFFPILTNLYSKKLVSEMKIFYRTVTDWIFIVTFPFLLTFIFFPGNILSILFGPEYVQGATALSLLSIMYFISAVFATSVFVLLVLNKTRYTMINIILGALIVLFGNIILTPIYGIYGAAITSLISAVFLNMMIFIEVRYFAKLNPFSIRIMAKSIFAGLVSMVFIYYLYKSLQIQSSLILLTLLFSLFLILYFLLMLLLRSFGKNDLLILSSLEKRIGIKSEFLKSIIKRFVHD